MEIAVLVVACFDVEGIDARVGDVALTAVALDATVGTGKRDEVFGEPQAAARTESATRAVRRDQRALPGFVTMWALSARAGPDDGKSNLSKVRA